MPMYQVQIHVMIHAPDAVRAETIANKFLPISEYILESQEPPKVIREIPPEEAEEYEAAN